MIEVLAAVSLWLLLAAVIWITRHHWHRDPGYKVSGIFVRYQCPCGARRIRYATTNLRGPVPYGWPELRDAHGFDVSDSGWQQPPAGGWPQTLGWGRPLPRVDGEPGPGSR